MSPFLVALFAAALDSSIAVPGDTSRAIVPGSGRVVRHFPPVEVAAGRILDLRSVATVHTVSPEALRDLPVTSIWQALALQPGVVAVGEDLHVRGGRAGDTQVTLAGLTLNEPLRDRAPELPLMAVQRADLLAGGLDAEYTGALAGVIELRTWNPGARPSGAFRWLSTGRQGTAYDWLGARGSLPLPSTGLGLVAAGEGRLDDEFLPQRPSRGRSEWLGRSLGWRNDNHLLGWAKLAPIANPQTFSLEVLGSRVVAQPFDPMFTVNDSVMIYTLTPPPGPGEIGIPTLDSMNVFYRAADHQPMRETRRITSIAQATRLGSRSQWRVALSWQHGSELVSPGLARDPRNLFPAEKLRFGQDMDPERDAFHAFAGEWAYFKRTRSDRWQAALSGSRTLSAKARIGYGAGAQWDRVEVYELDSVLPTDSRIDTVRSFRTAAPGGWAYFQHRWEHEGLVWNGGVRLQVFDAGRDAHSPLGVPPGGTVPLDERSPGARWSFSPRLGLAFPISVRDAMSLSYARIHQPPGREYLSDSRILIYSRRPLGNPALEPSELVTYQAGVKHLFNERWAGQVSVFHRDLYGQIGIANDPYFANTFRPRYDNVEYGHATGFEVALLAGARRGVPSAGSAPPGATARRNPLLAFLTGEFSARYTFMTAHGSLSGPDGWAYGSFVGARPLPIGEHPLDWDRGSMLGFDGVWREPHVFTLAWVTQIASGARWTPTIAYAGQTSGPLVTPDLSAVNSRQLPWTERTDFAFRWELAPLRGARLLVDVHNLFDSSGEAFVSVPGFPNPVVNTLQDDYAGYRTDTKRGGGAYWDPRLNGGQGGWVPVNDPRLRVSPRAVRFGIEMGL